MSCLDEQLRGHVILDALFGDWPVARPDFDMGDYLRKSGLRVVHIHPAQSGDAELDELTPLHHVTAVYEPRKDDNHTIEVALSLCSPKDTFNKKLGLAQALQRWEEGKRVKLPARRDRSLTDVELLKTYFQ
jgi:hypothetical protein